MGKRQKESSSPLIPQINTDQKYGNRKSAFIRKSAVSRLCHLPCSLFPLGNAAFVHYSFAP
jgi:hypothetical protein